MPHTSVLYTCTCDCVYVLCNHITCIYMHVQVISVGAGRYHTAVVTSKELLSFGKNLGQLGHDVQ